MVLPATEVRLPGHHTAGCRYHHVPPTSHGSTMAAMASAALELVPILTDLGTPLGDGTVRVDATVAELAELVGKSTGTVAHHLRQLDDLGVRVSSRPLVIRTDPQAGPAPSGVVGLIAGVLELGGRPEDTVDAISALLRCSGGYATQSREEDASRDVFDTGKEVGRGLSLVEPPSTSSLGTSEGSRNSRRVAQTTDLVKPLAGLCKKLGKPGVTSAKGLHEALAGLSDGEVEAGVADLCRELRQGLDDMARPVGVLISRARSGDLVQAADPGTVSEPPPASSVAQSNSDRASPSAVSSALESSRRALHHSSTVAAT